MIFGKLPRAESLEQVAELVCVTRGSGTESPRCRNVTRQSFTVESYRNSSMTGRMPAYSFAYRPSARFMLPISTIQKGLGTLCAYRGRRFGSMGFGGYLPASFILASS